MSTTAITADDLPGPILLDGLLQSFLLGTIVNQAFKYLMDYRNDSWQKRIFVVSVILLSIFQTMLEDYKVWQILILHRKWSTSRIEWLDLFLNGCICWLCEGFYIRRCWKMMDRSKWVLAPLSALSIIIMIANVYLAIAMGVAFRSGALEGTNDTLTASRFLLPSTIAAFSCWIFGSLVLEMTVTTILMLSLWKSKTGFKEIDKTVIKIIHMTWESASLPTVCMLIGAGLYHAQPRTDDHLVLFFVLLTGKFYTFGMLRTLNSRQKLRERMKSHDFGRTSLSTWQWNGTNPSNTDTAGQLSEMPVSLMSPEVSGGMAKTTKRLPTVDEFASERTLQSGLSVRYLGTPIMDAQETGVVRHRICSGN